MILDYIIVASFSIAFSFIVCGAILALIEETPLNPRRKYRVRVHQKGDNSLTVSIIGPGINTPIPIAHLHPGSDTASENFEERLIEAKVEAQDRADALNASRRIGR